MSNLRTRGLDLPPVWTGSINNWTIRPSASERNCFSRLHFWWERIHDDRYVAQSSHSGEESGGKPTPLYVIITPNLHALIYQTKGRLKDQTVQTVSPPTSSKRSSALICIVTKALCLQNIEPVDGRGEAIMLQKWFLRGFSTVKIHRRAAINDYFPN